MDQDIWADDLLGDRKAHAEFLTKFLLAEITQRLEKDQDGQNDRARRSYVLNLDAPWGTGKTFFLLRLRQQLELNHIVAFVDAWRDDYADDPLLPVIAAIKEALPNSQVSPSNTQKLAKDALDAGKRLIGAVALGAARQGLRKLVGLSIEELIHTWEGEPAESSNDTRDAAREVAAEGLRGAGSSLDQGLFEIGQSEQSAFELHRELVENFTNSLSSFAQSIEKINGKSGPLFIIIDELDRCRPDYAVKLLERVKHFFNSYNVVFIISTNNDQITHSIKSVYGSGFDANIYLQRFFDARYQLTKPSPRKLIEIGLSEFCSEDDFICFPNTSSSETFISYQAMLNMDARQLKRVLSILRTAQSGKPFKAKIILPYFLLLAWAYDRSDSELIEALSPDRDFSRSDAGKNLTSYSAQNNWRWPSFEAFDHRANRTSKISYKDMIEYIIKNIHKSLPEIGRSQQNSFQIEWLERVATNELSASNDGRYQAGKYYPFSPSYYLSLIRSAGQLSDVDSELTASR